MAKKPDSTESEPYMSSRLTTTAILAFIVMVLIIKILWPLTIPDIFPGAVEEGLMVGTLTWWTTIKLSLLVTLIFGLATWVQSGGAFRYKEDD